MWFVSLLQYYLWCTVDAHAKPAEPENLHVEKTARMQCCCVDTLKTNYNLWMLFRCCPKAVYMLQNCGGELMRTDLGNHIRGTNPRNLELSRGRVEQISENWSCRVVAGNKYLNIKVAADLLRVWFGGRILNKMSCMEQNLDNRSCRVAAWKKICGITVVAWRRVTNRSEIELSRGCVEKKPGYRICCA